MGNVPNLRFPEFTGEWEKKKMKDVCTFYSGGTPTSSNKDYYSGDIPFIRSGELHERSTELFISEDGLNNSSAKMVYKGDLLLALYGATSGDIAISQIEGAINQAILCINTQHSKEYIKSIWQKHVQKILQTYLQGGQGNLSADIVKNLSFYFASSKEQGKLANFIRLLDERITTQNKIIDKLQSLIKGLTISLTTQGEPNTTISLCLECHSSTLQESKVLPNGLYKVFGASGMVGYTDVSQMSGNAILIIKDGSGAGTTSYAQGEFSVIGTLNYLTAKGNYDLRYLYFAISVFNFQPYKTGMAIPHIYFKDYGNAKIYCPPLAEQKRIANVLGKLESKLFIEQELLASFNLQKRYLLSLMFI